MIDVFHYNKSSISPAMHEYTEEIKRRPRWSALMLLVLICGAYTIPAFADDWNAGTDNWFTGSNWLDGSVPTAADNTNIDNGGLSDTSYNCNLDRRYSKSRTGNIVRCQLAVLR